MCSDMIRGVSECEEQRAIYGMASTAIISNGHWLGRSAAFHFFADKLLAPFSSNTLAAFRRRLREG